MTESTAGDGNTNDVEVVVSLKHLSSFGVILKMLLINCEINLIVIFSVNFVIYSATLQQQHSSRTLPIKDSLFF